MKQIILGMFGLLLLLGTLLAEWNMYSLAVGTEDVEQSVRAVELLLKQRGEEQPEEAKLRTLISMELKERRESTHLQYQVKKCEPEDRRVQIQVQKEIPYFAEQSKRIVVETTICW